MTEQSNNRIEQLEKRIKKLEEHQHLGYDGSKEFDDRNKVGCRELTISGLPLASHLFAIPSLRIYDNDEMDKKKRMASLAMGVSLKGKEGEQNNVILQTGEGEIRSQSNREDWDSTSFSQLIMSHSPKDYPWWVFEKPLPATAFLTSKRTPIVLGEGTISGNTLTDENADFPVHSQPTSLEEAEKLTNSLVHGICIAKDADFNALEANVITDTTKNTIVCERTWDTQGAVRYEVLIPTILGSANAPFSLGYFGDGIVLGYGARTDNNKISTIRWGTGAPEGEVIAAPGSLYLRQDGGAGTTLYIKESGDNDSSGWVAK